MRFKFSSILAAPAALLMLASVGVGPVSASSQHNKPVYSSSRLAKQEKHYTFSQLRQKNGGKVPEFYNQKMQINTTAVWSDGHLDSFNGRSVPSGEHNNTLNVKLNSNKGHVRALVNSRSVSPAKIKTMLNGSSNENRIGRGSTSQANSLSKGQGAPVKVQVSPVVHIVDVNNQAYMGNSIFGYVKIGIAQQSNDGRNFHFAVSPSRRDTYNELSNINARESYAQTYQKIGDSHDAQLMLNGFDNKQEQQISHWVAYYINRARKSHGLKPYQSSSRLQTVSDLRAIQSYPAWRTMPSQFNTDNLQGDNAPGDDWIHGKDFHDSSMDAINSSNVAPINDQLDPDSDSGMTAENAGPIEIGSHKNVESNSIENDRTPREIAFNDVNDMINYDRYTKNGHAKAILSKDFHYMGVGIKFVPEANGDIKGSIIQEFA